MCLYIKISSLYKNNHKKCKLTSYYFHLSFGQYSTKFSYKRVLQILVAGDIVKTASYLFSQKKEERKKKMGTKFMTDFRN